MSGLDANGGCGQCHGDITVRRVRQEVGLMVDPPRTVNRWCDDFYWQCLRIQSHHGAWRETAGGTPTGEEAKFSGLTQSELWTPTGEEPHGPR